MPVNCLRVSGFPLTITSGTSGSDISGSIANVNDGDRASQWINRVSQNNGCSNYTWYKVTFTNPVTVTKIHVQYSGFGREQQGACGSSSGSASQTTKVNSVQVAGLNGPGNAGGAGASEANAKIDTTLRTGVTEVFIEMNSSSPSCANLNPREASNYLYELEIYVDTTDGGGMIC